MVSSLCACHSLSTTTVYHHVSFSSLVRLRGRAGQFCGKNFSRKDALKQHERVHTKEGEEGGEEGDADDDPGDMM